MMGPRRWLGVAVVALGLAAGAAACQGTGGGEDACPMKSTICQSCRGKYGSWGCRDEACLARYDVLKDCVCAAQIADESYEACATAFEAVSQEAKELSVSLQERCHPDCDY